MSFAPTNPGPNQPKRQKLRWFWYYWAACEVISTPDTILPIVRDALRNHLFFTSLVIVVVGRFGVTGLLYWLWWRDRPYRFAPLQPKLEQVPPQP